MTALPGALLDYELNKNGTLSKGSLGDWKFYPVPTGPALWYRMRAWYAAGAAFEVWTSSGSPDPNPPSGHPVTGVTIIGIWEA